MDPTCCGKDMARNGLTNAGSQRYRCRACGKSTTVNPKKHGRLPDGDIAMTIAERQRKYYWRKKTK